MHPSRGSALRLAIAWIAALLGNAGFAQSMPIAGTWHGVLPCADCEGLRYELELRRDQTYVLRNTYLGKGPLEPGRTVFDDIGRWLISNDGEVLAIKGAREAPEYFALSASGKSLRKLDQDGQPIDSPANHLLERSRKAPSWSPRLPLHGMLAQGVDAALFTECATGLRWEIANEADWPAAERALAKARDEARPKPAAPLLVALDATLNGSALVIDRFNAVLDDKAACDPLFATLPLSGTVWTLTRLGAQSEPVPNGSYGAQIRLTPGRNPKVSGHTGCNRLISSAELRGASVRFGAQIASRVACVANGAGRIEAGLLDAIENARRWRSVGAVLELLDEQMRLLARFEGEAPER